MQPTQLNLEGQSRQREAERERKQNIPLSSTPFSNLFPFPVIGSVVCVFC